MMKKFFALTTLSLLMSTQALASNVRVIEVHMDDSMRFSPSHIEVKQGEKVRLNITNDGQLPHELIIGNIEELMAHAEEMRTHKNMHHHHSHNAITLNQGEQGEITWQFENSGTLEFACLIPGHFEAGMKGSFEIN